MGDSWTFGAGLQYADTYANQLQIMVNNCFGENKVQIINGGCGGYGTSEYTAFVEEFGEIFHPELLVVYLNADDVGRCLTSGIHVVDENGITCSISPKKIGSSFGRTLKRQLSTNRIYDYLISHSHLLRLIREAGVVIFSGVMRQPRKIRQAVGDVAPSSPPTGLGDYASSLEKALFRRLQNWCAQHNCRLLVLTTGWEAFIDMELRRKEKEPTGLFYAEAEEFFKKSGIQFHFLSGPVGACVGGLENLNDFIIPGDSHPNPRGAQCIASASWPYLKNSIEAILSQPRP